MLDVLRRVIDGRLSIPTRQQVAERTKVALISDGSSSNTPADLFTGLYKLDSDGEHKANKNWLKKTGRYPTLPFIHGSPADANAYQILVRQSEYASMWPTQGAKLAELSPLFPAESTGDLFVGRLANNWLAYNPQLNTDLEASGEFELKYNSCSSMALTYAPHTFSVIKEGADSLAVYLNNYRTDKDPLWEQYPDGFTSSTLQSAVLPGFIDNPTDGALREGRIVIRGCDGEPSFTATEAGVHEPSQTASSWQGGVFTLTVLHNGPLIIDIRAAGSHAGRLPVPIEDPIRPPAPPSTSGW